MVNPSRFLVLLLAVAVCALSATAQNPAPYPVAKPVAKNAAPLQSVRLLPDSQKGQIAQFIEYQEGKLRVVAEDSTLDSVLQAISQVTGTRIELPPGMLSERIAVTLGPAPMAEVMHALLDSSRFNYVIMGSPQQPDAISSIVIKLRAPNAPLQPGSVTPGQPGYPGTPVTGQPFNGAPQPYGATAESIQAQQARYQQYVAAQQDQQQKLQLMQQQQQQQLMQQQQLVQQQERAQEMGTPPPQQ